MIPEGSPSSTMRMGGPPRTGTFLAQTKNTEYHTNHDSHLDTFAALSLFICSSVSVRQKKSTDITQPPDARLLRDPGEVSTYLSRPGGDEIIGRELTFIEEEQRLLA